MRKLITIISIICIMALIFTGCQAASTTEIQKQDTAVQKTTTDEETTKQATAEPAATISDTEQTQQTEEQKAQDIIALLKSSTADIASVQPVSHAKPVTQVKTSTQVKATTQAKTTTQAGTTAQTKATVQAKTSTQTKTAVELENHLINLVLSQRKLQKLPSIPRKKELDDAATYMARTGDLPSDFSDKYKNFSSFCVQVYKMLQSEVDESFTRYKPDLMKEATTYGAGYYKSKDALIICFIQAEEAKQQDPEPQESEQPKPAPKTDTNQPVQGTPMFQPEPGRCFDIEKYIQSIIKAPRDPELDNKALEYAKTTALSNGKAKIELMESDKYIIEFPNWGAFLDDQFRTIGLLTDKVKRNPLKYGVGAYATSSYVSVWIIEFFPYNP